jgi:hypothetical protein
VFGKVFHDCVQNKIVREALMCQFSGTCERNSLKGKKIPDIYYQGNLEMQFEHQNTILAVKKN